MITYARNLEDVNWDIAAKIIEASGLGQAAPDDLRRSFKNSQHAVFAYRDCELVGFARAISDGVYHAEICEMAVMPAMQRQGIGKAMLTMLLDDLAGIKVTLLSSFGAVEFYEKMGFRRHKAALAINWGEWWYEG